MLSYDHDAIDGHSHDIAVTSQKFNAELEDLKRLIAPLQGTWTAHAAEAYRIAQTKWDNAAADLNLILQDLGVRVGAGNQDMLQTDKSAGSAWG